MKSISTKLAVIFILIFLVIVTTVSAIIIIISSKSIKELTIQGISNRMEIQADGMQKMFLQRASVINMVAQIVMDEETIEQDYIQSVISPLYEERNEYNLYVGFEDDRAFFADYWEPESSWRATERDWYIEGKANPGKTISTVPYVDAQTGEVCITMVYGMVKDGKFIGVVALDVWQDDLLEPMQGNSAASDNQYAMLLDNAGNIYYHPNEELAPSVDGIKNLKEMDGGKYLPIFSLAAHNDYTLIRNYENKPSYYVTSGVEGTDWIVCGVILKSELEKEMNRQIWLTVLISFSMIVLSVIIVIYVVRKMITVPINHMLNAALVMATGDLDVEVDTHANDEMGEFGRAFQVIIENTKENVRAIKAIAEGDLTQCVKIGSDKDVMGISLTAMLDSNNEVMGEILAASRQVSACSQQIADVSQQLTSGSLEQSEAVDNLSSNVAEITSFTKDNMELSGNAVRLSAEIIGNAERGGEQMSEMLDAVRKINEAARSIGHVIKTIDDIAFQTNILALNASVEAARAGQHGKGFAVVAEEVRNLATKSADAAKNTSELISDTMEKAELGSRLASETADSFERIVDGVRNSTEKIKEISTYSEKQVSAIEAIADELNNVSRVAQQNSASAEETAAAGSEMSSQSSTLQGLIGQFKIREGASNYSPHSLDAQTTHTGFSVNKE